MEEKYCERCGVFLGLVNPCKKYCEECKIIVRRERQALIKKGIKAKPEPALCAWCKKPMVRKVWSQKYHPECAADANKALTKKYKAKKQKELNKLKASGEFKITWDVQEPERARPQKREPPKVYRATDERCRKTIRYELRALQHVAFARKGESS